jgi:hypothetical protein
MKGRLLAFRDSPADFNRRYRAWRDAHGPRREPARILRFQTRQWRRYGAWRRRQMALRRSSTIDANDTV